MEFVMSDSNINDIEELRKYKNCGYCVLNAVTNVLKANGGNITLLDVQKNAKWIVKQFFDSEDGYELYKTMIKELYELGVDYAKLMYNRMYDYYEHDKNYYAKNTSCMNGNCFWMEYALLKFRGYTLKNVGYQVGQSTLENWYKMYGNFVMCVRGHASSVCNGKITDFDNHFEKHEFKWTEEGWKSTAREMRKKVHYIIYKTR